MKSESLRILEQIQRAESRWMEQSHINWLWRRYWCAVGIQPDLSGD